MNLKKTLALLLALLMVVSMAACGKTEEPASPSTPATPADPATPAAPAEPAKADTKYMEHVTYAANGQITLLDPEGAGNDNAQHGILFNMVYNQLTALDFENVTVVPELATEWTFNDTFDKVNVKLRDDVYFHNGEKLTADDVAFTLQRESSAIWRPFIDTVEVVSPTEVNLNLTSSCSELMNYLAITNSSIVCKKAVEADAEVGPTIGSGPWVIDYANYVAGDKVELVRNDNFWGEKPVAKYFTYQYVGNQSSRLIAVQNGEAQITSSIATNEEEYAREDKNLKVWDFDALSTYYIAFNTQAEPFNDENFRKAVTYGINKEEILAATGSTDSVITNTLFCRAALGYNPNPSVINEYNPDLAKEYLAKTPYRDFEFMANTTNGTYKTIAEVAQEQLRQIGINVTIREVDSAGLSANSKYSSANHQCMTYSISLNPYSSDIGRLLKPNTNSNKSIVFDEELNQLFADALKTDDKAKLEEIYGKVQVIVNEHAYYIPLWYSNGMVVTSNKLSNFTPDPTTRHNYSFVKVEE